MVRYWTKKIDDLHIVDDNGNCLCSKPMLGNNYSDSYKELDKSIGREERKVCKICMSFANSIKE